jgi:hypothetical protein
MDEGELPSSSSVHEATSRGERVDAESTAGASVSATAVGADVTSPGGRVILENRVADLELKLRERVEENLVLDSEVRHLQKDRQILQEYVASLEAATIRVPDAEQALVETENELAEARRQLDAFRNRLSSVVADRIVASFRRFPMAYRIGHAVTHKLVRLLRG